MTYIKRMFNLVSTIDEPSKVFLLVNSILALTLITTQIYLMAFYGRKIPSTIILISIICSIAYLVLSIYSIVRTTQFESTKENLKESQLYNKTLSTLHDNVRCFKHDFNNIIQSIGGYIQIGDMKGLKKYYSQLFSDCQNLNNLAVLNPKLINNPAIYNLLSNKYYYADSKKIKFNLEIFLDINSISMKTYELSKIIGILLDNAIEATSECDEKIINFELKTDFQHNRQLLIIENTYKDKNIDTEKIYEKDYTSKPNNTGLGLWEVRKILNKHDNLNLYTTKNNKFFIQQLEIY